MKWHSVKSDKNGSALFEKSSNGSLLTNTHTHIKYINIYLSILKHTNNCVDFSELVISNYSISADGLLKVNNDHIGFYRVNHNVHMWNIISEQLQNNHMVMLS